MDRFPCENCITYPICRMREPSERFNVCEIYTKYIMDKFFKQQNTLDKEHGKGVRTIIGISTPDSEFLISKDGKHVGTINDWGIKNEGSM